MSTARHYTNPGFSSRYAPNENASVYSGNTERAPTIKSIKTVSTTYNSSYYSDQRSLLSLKKDKWSKFKKRVWNEEKKELCGRTWDSWLKIVAFYLVFYIVLAGYFLICFAFFDWRVLMEDYPVRTGEGNLLRMSPGLSLIPMPDHYTSLIRFKRSQKASYRKYVDDMVAVTQFYEKHAFADVVGQSDEILVDCARTGGNEPFDPRKVCNFDLDVGGRCNFYRQFGFSEGAPCVALKLNRIYGWIPDLGGAGATNSSEILPTGVKVLCEGVHQSDKDSITKICYHDENSILEPDLENACRPYGEFKHYFFPYLKQNRYMSPLVFVEFHTIKPNVVIMVQCTAYAKNIKVDRRTREGVVTFELLMD